MKKVDREILIMVFGAIGTILLALSIIYVPSSIEFAYGERALFPLLNYYAFYLLLIFSYGFYLIETISGDKK